MGTDVHMVFQKKKVIDTETVEWEDIESGYEEIEDPRLFTWLSTLPIESSNVSTSLESISGENILNGLKNLPTFIHREVLSLEDFRVWDGKPIQRENHYRKHTHWGDDKGTITVPMSSDSVKGNRGNYSLHLSSYLTNYRDKLIGTSRLKLRTKPSKMKLLKKLMKYQDQVNYRYVEVNWEVSSDDLKQEFSYFTDEVQRLIDLHGEIRVVFGFYS